jgi:DNA-binding transcriptional ArsR family regulator
MSAKYTFWAWEVDINKAPLKLTLLQLANNANDDGVSWYSVPKMARRCGMSERALQGHIKTLEEMSLLVVKDRPGTSRIYELQYSEVLLKCGTPAESAPQPPQNLHHTPAESADDLNNEFKIEPNNYLSAKADQKQQSKRALYVEMATRFMELLPNMPPVDLKANATQRVTKAVNFYKNNGFDPQRWDAYLSAISECDWMMQDRVDSNGKVWKRKNFDFIITEKCYLGVKEDRYGSANANQNA